MRCVQWGVGASTGSASVDTVIFFFVCLPLTAFAERLVAGARGRLLPPWVTDVGGIRSEASSGLPPPLQSF